MNDDLLQRATRALREESTPSPDDLAETRARLLASSTTKKARRTSALRWVLPMAAAFAAGTAFAATNGQLERAVQAVRTWLVEAPRAESPEPKPKRVAKKQVVEERPAIVEAPVAPPVAPQVVEAVQQVETPSTPAPALATREGASSERPAALRSRERRESAREPGSTSGASEAPESEPKPDEVVANQAIRDTQPAPKPSESPDLALYREAHRTHFVARDYADALTLWNGYLVRFPGGIFVLEARYNRAICLVRLGRKEEASLALRPFAEGQVKGAYRRDEARALLDALDKKP